jgi:hypothetical protein
MRAVSAEASTRATSFVLDVRGVHDHQEMLRAGAVHDDVVDDRALLAAEQSVPSLPHFEAGDVARDQTIDRCARLRPIEVELAHVRQIEHARVLAHRAMLPDDPGVLDRHLVARERHHARAEGAVLLVERRPPQRSVGRHAAARAASIARSSISR